ncbi:hypothetical protein PsYK624_082370 [Phanerochaete sordida]|uniref:Protein kinase domain-containing protein n=1 Tax=Phanerochaete sordida TaxID=48140 RepID=A0A9P3GD05_9APHY|nr:hypothetical protein PsYK624_082370 [Phanerochaete sordida]
MSSKPMFSEFMGTKCDMSSFCAANFSEVPAGSTVQEMARRFICAVERSKLCPELQFFITRTKKRHVKPDGEEPPLDLCAPLAARKITHTRRNRKNTCRRGYLDFSNAILEIDIHPSSDADAWTSCDPPSSSAPASAKPSDEAQAFRKAVTSHIQARYRLQHNIFLFHVVIFGRYARCLYYDRAGCVVTQRIDFVADPRPLSEFLWRFARMGDEQRGHDLTVTRAAAKEAAIFRRAVEALISDMDEGATDDVDVRPLPAAYDTIDSTGVWPYWKIEVSNPTTGEHSHLVINKSLRCSPDLQGRCTRAYIAYDLQKRRLVFMKDSWRLAVEGLLPEFQTYQQLHTHNVPHIPEVLYGGDVLDGAGRPHTTLAQKYTRGTQVIHHRIVQEIAFSLDSATDEKEFVQAFHDALCAMEGAYNAAGILHRDISINNIMLDADGRGVLNDWDCAGSRDNLQLGIGTWDFMSTMLLKEPNTHLHDIVDDLQSIFWVLLCAASEQYVVGDVPIANDMFEEERPYSADSTVMAGGGKKHFFIWEGRMDYIEFSTFSLTNLALRCSERWKKYLEATHEDAQDSPENRAVRDLTATPSYWRDLFAVSAANTVSVFPRVARPPTVDGPAPVANSLARKRKADAGDGPPPRRSKRLKILRGEESDP